MKRIYNLTALFLMFNIVSTTQAQEIGLRLGNVLENSVAIDGLLEIKGNNRVHANLSFSDQGLGVSGLWGLEFKPINDFPDLHWYAGAGPYAIIGKRFDLGLATEIGIEYQFLDYPITLGFDLRPQLEIIDKTRLLFNQFGLNIRYQIQH